MGFLFRRGKPDPKPGPGPLLARARRGEREARDQILELYGSRALSIAASATGKYVRAGVDDEASVALLALNEAIDAYDPERGVEFGTFLNTVVRRRIIDHQRRESRRRELPLSQLVGGDEEGRAEGAAVLLGAVEAHARRTEAQDRRAELEAYREELGDYGITLQELARVCPRHRDARVRALQVAWTIVRDPKLRRHLQTRRELPLGELERRVAVSRKTMERQRKYLIALCLILMGDYGFLQEYLRVPGGVRP